MAPASSKDSLDIQATIVCGFSLKRVHDMIKAYNNNHNWLSKLDFLVPSNMPILFPMFTDVSSFECGCISIILPGQKL